MSSMSFWNSGSLSSDVSTGRARSRSTGCPIRATFRIDIAVNYMVRLKADTTNAMLPHDERPYSHCPLCGADLELRSVKPTEPDRLVCTQCGFIFYQDPKVAVGTIIRNGDDQIVLVRRAIEPGYGKWVFPGGFVDRGELVTTAAVREAREEAGLDIRLDHLLNVYSYPGRAPVIIVYVA